MNVQAFSHLGAFVQDLTRRVRHDVSVQPVVSPSLDDNFVTAESHGLGGPLGKRAQLSSSRWTPFIVGILLAGAVFSIGIVMRGPCAESGFQDGTVYIKMCYTDIGKLYVDRGLDRGNFPYASRLDGTDYVEYPVLQGLLMWIPTKVIGTTGDVKARTIAYYALSSLLLYALLLLAIWATVQSAGRRPWDALILAAAPSIALVGTLNWDLLPVALLALASLAWSRERPWLCGVLIGLGAAAKLYPFLLLVALFVLAVRTRRFSGFTRATLGAIGAWVAVNLPFAWLYPEGWRTFYELSRDRGFDFGSVWLSLRFLGVPVDKVDSSQAVAGSFGLLVLGVIALSLFAPRRPRLVQVLLLIVIAFAITNKVYSPQFALWLLPLVALARPRWRDVLIWQSGQAIYYVGVWLWLNKFTEADRSLDDRSYAILILIQIASSVYIAGLVIRDIWKPEHDPVRMDGSDDPQGGEFDGLPDHGRASEPVVEVSR